MKAGTDFEVWPSVRVGLCVLALSSFVFARASDVLEGRHARRGSVSEREYLFVHHETAAVTAAILVPGARSSPGRRGVAIVFSKDSDRDALEALHALDYRVLLPNGNGAGIVVVGLLDPRVHHSPSGPGRLASEPYQEFRLSRWYLLAPFPRWVGEPMDDDFSVQKDGRLRPEDFGNKIGGDLSRFVRAR